MESCDLIVVGGGPTGLACAIEATRADLDALVIEKGCSLNSLYNYPTDMLFFTTGDLLEIGDIPLTCAAAKPTRREALEYYRRVAEHYGLRIHQYERVDAVERRGDGFRLRSTRRTGGVCEYDARRVVLATGYYDLHNYLNVPGEGSDHVFHYYREAHPFSDCDVVVVGGKNSAALTALDLYRHGARVTLVHRHEQLSSSIKYWIKPDIENRIKAGQIAARFNTEVTEILPSSVRVRAVGAHGQNEDEIPADFVFAMVGYHPDFDFLRACGVMIDPQTCRPVCNPQTFETNVPGLYLAGVIVAGVHTSEIFIENGRFHGKVIVDDIRQKRAISSEPRMVR